MRFPPSRRRFWPSGEGRKPWSRTRIGCAWTSGRTPSFSRGRSPRRVRRARSARRSRSWAGRERRRCRGARGGGSGRAPRSLAVGADARARDDGVAGGRPWHPAATVGGGAPETGSAQSSWSRPFWAGSSGTAPWSRVTWRSRTCRSRSGWRAWSTGSHADRRAAATDALPGASRGRTPLDPAVSWPSAPSTGELVTLSARSPRPLWP